MTLSDFVGNEPLKRHIADAIQSDRLSHAVIIEGQPGSGRRTLARILARTAACTGENPPCGVCSSCRASQPADIHEILPAKGNITVDQIRDLRDMAYIVPNQSKKSVFIIPDAQLMNAQAQNALLKVFEEPPETAMFILTCEHTHQLLSTVISRAWVLSVCVPSPDEVSRYIKENYPQYDAKEIENACTGGTVGEALMRLSGGAGYLADAVKVAECLTTGEMELHVLMHSYEKDRPALKGIVSALRSVIHDALVIRTGGSRHCISGELSERLARRFTPGQLMRLCEVCDGAAEDCDANIGPALFITCFCSSLADIMHE